MVTQSFPAALPCVVATCSHLYTASATEKMLHLKWIALILGTITILGLGAGLCFRYIGREEEEVY